MWPGKETLVGLATRWTQCWSVEQISKLRVKRKPWKVAEYRAANALAILTKLMLRTVDCQCTAER